MVNRDGAIGGRHLHRPSDALSCYAGYGEDPPLHFRAVQGNDDVMLRIADFGVEAGSLNPVALAAAQSWARMHQAELALK
jgi:uncharacterized protein DUF4160